MRDVTGQPHPAEDIRAALDCISQEMVRDPLAKAKNGEPLVMHYLVIRDALQELLALRALLESKAR